MKKFIPLLFTTDMMVANLEGIKNQTRRGRGLDVINENPDDWQLTNISICADSIFVTFTSKHGSHCTIKCPYGQDGDVLWFREKWRRNEAMTGPPFHWYALNDVYTDPDNEKWKPNMHMPARACRAFGVIEEIRIERLRDISEQDAIDEGIEAKSLESVGGLVVYKNYMLVNHYTTPVQSYFSLFESINGGGLTYKNPWLWQVKYKFTTEEQEGWKQYVQKLISEK